MGLLSKIIKSERLARPLKFLYIHRVLRDIGGSLVGIFGVIFVYTLTDSIEITFIFYGVMQLLYLFLLPLWAKLIKYFSINTLMIMGSFFFSLYYVVFYFLAKTEQVFLLLIAVIILVLFKLFYWVPYHIDFVRFISRHHKGRQLSFLAIVIAMTGIFLPIFSAFIITNFGFPSLFVVAIILTIISIIPILYFPKIREEYSFGYFETFKKLISKKHFKTNLSFIADGFQSYISILIWPIFIFVLLKEQFMGVGIVSAIIVLVVSIFRYIVGEATDRFNKDKLIKTGTLLYSLGWVFKAIISSGLGIFLAGVYHDFVYVILRTPVDVLTYDIAADEGHYIDEFTVLREMSLGIGRVVMVGMAILIVNYVDIIWVFVLGAIISLPIVLITRKEFYVAQRS